ncbi:MAG TPA: CopD family protein [Gemmatimonadaceae bacterium]|nr:CopD family protein [Gemmatimonadaceae bacterium]
MSLIEWPKPFVEYAGFLAAYATIGAVAFRYAVLTRTLVAMREEAAVRAAWIGAAGSVLGVVYLVAAAMSSKKGHSVPLVPMTAIVAAGVGFVLAARRMTRAWALAALATTVFAVRSMHLEKWTSTVNPLHVIGGALWLGTLFVLVAAALPAALHTSVPAEERGLAAAWLVRAFSPVAIVGASLLALTGVITAVRHVKYLAALWTTPYGFALDVKLIAVLAVVAFGYWNWQRITPRLGDETAARELHTSARYEIVLACVVLVITGVLVSLPSPKLP